MIINDVNSLLMMKSSPLPTGYTLLNWLQGDGNTTSSRPYIDLGFYFSKTDMFRVEIDAQYTGLRTGNYFFGKYGSTATTAWAVAIGANATNFQFRIGNTTTTAMSANLDRHLFILDRSAMTWAIDNNTGNLATLVDATLNTASYRLFGWHHTNTTYAQWSNAKIYDFKAYLDNSLIHHLLPALRDADTTPGMYDIITNTFFVNAGTGSFTYG